jgi:aspartate racemase
MDTIGLLGGMSWESTSIYYRLINQLTRLHLDGLHSAPLLIWSADFEEIERLMREGRWETAGDIVAVAARNLESAGARLLLLCCNTMHKVAPQIEEAVSIPMLHIADVTAERIKRRGLRHIALLGTRYTMEEDFYVGRLTRNHGLRVLTPKPADRELIDRVIFDELCTGTVRNESREYFLRVIEYLGNSGAEGVIAGCTEIGMLIEQRHMSLPLFDTTHIHAEEAVRCALAKPWTPRRAHPALRADHAEVTVAMRRRYKEIMS